MSDRGRPHNLGQALFESLGAGLRAYGIGLEQERIRKSETAQQTFLNRLRVESGARAQIGLEQGQERLDLAQNIFGLSQQRLTAEQERFEIGQEIDPIEQAQIDANQALTAKRTRETELLGTSAGRSMFGTGVGSTIFNQLNLGFQLREFNRLVAKGDPQFATPDPETDGFLPRQDVDVGMIATPEDTLRVLLQKAKRITGEAPTTTLQGLGKEPVFPRADFNELAQQPELQQKRIESRQRAVE